MGGFSSVNDPLARLAAVNAVAIAAGDATAKANAAIAAAAADATAKANAAQAAAIAEPIKRATGSFTRDLSLASGSVPITGIGFKPTKITIRSKIAGTVTGSDGTAVQNGATITNTCEYTTSVGGSDNVSGTQLLYIIQAVGATQVAAVASFDVDGFTLAWTKVGAPVGTLSAVFEVEGR